MDNIAQPIIEELPGIRNTVFGYFINNSGVEVKLKADAYHRKLYAQRGYKYVGDNPTQFDHRQPLPEGEIEALIERSKTNDIVSESFQCEICGKECSDATSLGCHKRVHKGRTKKKK